MNSNRTIPLWITLLLILFGAVSTLAQDASLPPLAAVQDGNVWLFGFTDTAQPITDGTARSYSNLVWSSDGNYLAFIARDQDFNANVMLYDRTNGTLTMVEEDSADGFPIQFSFDSSQLFYAKDNPDNGSSQQFVTDFYTANLPPVAATTRVGSFNISVGCGGGSPFPADWRYWEETSGFGGFHLVLEVTPFGLVHSLDCGGWQTGLLNLETGQDVVLGEISRVAISPDRTKAAGITDLAGDRSNERLVVVDLQTGTITQLETMEPPDQVAWAAQGSSQLFYSTRRETENPIPLTAEQQQQVNTMLGAETALFGWEVSIHQFDVTFSADTTLYTADAYAIGRMIPAFDGSSLIFSQIPNAGEWLQGITAIDLSAPESFTRLGELVEVQLFRLPLDGGSAELLATNLNQVALNPAAE
jgi:dipeptidyl aminopeptidase/acylaminoacyl peptidase